METPVALAIVLRPLATAVFLALVVIGYALLIASFFFLASMAHP